MLPWHSISIFTTIAWIIMFSGAALSSAAKAAEGETPAYPWDLKQSAPTAYQSYLKILPPSSKNINWVGRLRGTGQAIETISLDGKRYLSGFICKPHACDLNHIAFLIEVDGSRAIALLKSTETKGRVVELGNPSASEVKYLREQMVN
jgi:hypothetical protein